MNDWILENLRNVENSADIQNIIQDPMGVPAFTPVGFRQIQEVQPKPDEWQVLSEITGAISLSGRALKKSISTRSCLRSSALPPPGV